MSIADYREKHKDLYPAHFNGYFYFAFANVVALAGMAGGLWMLRAPTVWEWLTVPGAFVFANFAEWLAHRGPMHNRRALMDILFERHTLVHHSYFPHTDMSVPNHHHWGYVLFPSWAIFLVFAAAAPVGLVAGVVLGANCGWLFFVTAIGYYLLYEWLHLIHHLPETHAITRSRVGRWLRGHHTHHHNHRLMQRYNFNVSFPIADFVMGTYYREAKQATTQHSESKQESESE